VSVQTVSLAIEGMSCGHCLAAVKQALTGVPGVEIRQLQLGSATVELDPAKASIDAVVEAVNDAGYTAHASA
jgi:copper chaperone CopZ